jgi:putative transposase
MYVSLVMRHTTFRFALDPTPAQAGMLARHAGASRFAYNQCLRLVTDALQQRTSDPTLAVPWSGFDLINAFNAWKRSEAAGRSFVVAPDATITKHVTGLVWQRELSAQVFEEAAVDLGRALVTYEQGRVAKVKGGSASRGTSAKVGAARASGSAIRRAAAPPGRSGSGKVIPAR